METITCFHCRKDIVQIIFLPEEAVVLCRACSDKTRHSIHSNRSQIDEKKKAVFDMDTEISEEKLRILKNPKLRFNFRIETLNDLKMNVLREISKMEKIQKDLIGCPGKIVITEDLDLLSEDFS